MGFLRSVVLTVCIVGVIGLTTVFFAVRTEGGRSFVEHRLERATGLDLRIARVRIGWPYALVIESLATEPFAQGQAGFRAQRLRVSLGWTGRRRLQVTRGELILAQDERGGWQPSFFERAGPLPEADVRRLERVTAAFRGRWTVDATDGTIRWMDATGEETASASGITFRIEPVDVPDHRMYYARLALYTLKLPAGRFTDVEREWLLSDRAPYVELYAPSGVRNRRPCAWFTVPSRGESDGTPVSEEAAP